MARAIENSLILGLYSAEGTQVGFARFVTDYATFAWLCDVFVDAAHRDRGLGTFLVDTAVGHPDVRGVRQILAAEPGRSLYARFGYGPWPTRNAGWTALVTCRDTLAVRPSKGRALTGGPRLANQAGRGRGRAPGGSRRRPGRAGRLGHPTWRSRPGWRGCKPGAPRPGAGRRP